MIGGSHTSLLGVNGARVGYSREQILLDRCNLEAAPGEMVALIGKNGSGKSTLLKSILGVIPFLEGSCQINGMPAGEMDPGTRARSVSYVASQVSPIPSLTVRDLVGLGRIPHTGWFGRLRDADWQKVDRAMDQLRIGHFREKRIDRLSDGERQRAMIARALVQETPLMLLDEPTAFLDLPHRLDLIRTLAGFTDRGNSVVYSTHDLESALLYADKLWVIHLDTVREGAPEDLGIEGIFDELFTGSGIRFDSALRRFSRSDPPRGTVRLEGSESEDATETWTRNALERLGYQEATSGEDLTVILEPSEAGTTWTVRSGDSCHSFESIYRMARFLIREK